MMILLRRVDIGMRVETVWDVGSTPLHGSPVMWSVQFSRMLNVSSPLQSSSGAKRSRESVEHCERGASAVGV